MTAFACRSRDATGKVVEKTVDADSKREALRLLEACGLSPIEITVLLEGEQRAAARPAETTPAAKEANAKIGLKVLRRFTIQLGSSLKAGVPMRTALQSMAAQASDARYAAALAQLVADIESGLPLSEGMRRLPKAFPRAFAATIEAGEQSGTLDEMLENLAEYLEAEMEMRADIRSAVMYPVIVSGTLCLAVSILVFFVVPRFATFYAGFNAELPFPTRVLIGLSELVKEHGLWLLLGLVVSGVLAARALAIPSVRRAGDGLLRKIPYLGRMVEAATTLQIAQMLHLFTGAGVPLLAGLETIAAALRSSRSKEDLRSVAAGVETGATLAEGLESASCLPPDARQMIATGEQTGSLHQACAVIAAHYKKELRYLTKNVSTFIEPVLTLLLAVVVLFVALAAFLPMWDLVRVVRG